MTVNELETERLIKEISNLRELSSVDFLVETAWLLHAPFMKWLIRTTKPDVFVELGVHSGFSFFTACEAISQFELNTKAFGIDTWKGDDHAGLYGEDVLELVNQENARFPFAKLIRSTFDEAKSQFETGSIDLLHIDGFHTYEAVSHDFHNWLPLMSDRGIILLHDIHVRRSDFGVYRFWNEIRQNFITFEFPQSFGLGCVFLNKELINPDLQILTSSDPYDQEKIKGSFLCHSSNLLAQKLFAQNNFQHYANSSIEMDAELERLKMHCQKLENQISSITSSRYWKLGIFWRFLGSCYHLIKSQNRNWISKFR